MLSIIIEFGTRQEIYSLKSYHGHRVENLALFIMNQFQINLAQCLLLYQDSDSDWVTIANQRDWDEAMAYMEGEKATSLRMKLVFNQSLHASQHLADLVREYQASSHEDTIISDACKKFHEQLVDWVVQPEAADLKKVVLGLLKDAEVQSALKDLHETDEFHPILQSIVDAIASSTSIQDLLADNIKLDEDLGKKLIDALSGKLARILVPMMKLLRERSQAKEETVRVKMPHEKYGSIHEDVVCDGCEQCPIVGVRYKSLYSTDYDLCQHCEESGRFDETYGPFIKYRHPVIKEKNTGARGFAKSDIIHRNIVCDGCEVTPIRGVRYKSSITRDFDVCEACEASGRWYSHAPFLKIDHPSLAPAALVVTLREAKSEAKRRKAAYKIAKRAEKSEEALLKKVRKLEMKRLKQASKIMVKKLHCEFVEDASIPDGTTIAPKALFTKSWILRNSSETEAWPEGCYIMNVGGHNLSCDEHRVAIPALNPGQQTTVDALMRAPETNGRYIGNWRLFHPNGLRFGHRFWVDIIVDDEAISADLPVTEGALETISVSTPIPAGDNTLIAEQSSTDVNPLFVVEDTVAVEPLVEDVPDDISSLVKALTDMGFSDPDANLAILRSVGGDLSQAIDKLLQ